MDKLMLMVGVPLPCPQLRTTVHQPKIRDIAYLGEKEFFKFLGYLKISKRALFNIVENSSDYTPEEAEQVKKTYDTASDFQIIMKICQENIEISRGIATIMLLFFPGYSNVEIEEPYMIVKGTNKSDILIGDAGFQALNILIDFMFKLNEVQDTQEEFKPANKKAEEIAKKIQKRREKVAKEQGKNDEGSSEAIIATFISSLSVAIGLDIKAIEDWTIYQLFTQMKRYNLFAQHEQQFRAAMVSGSEGIEWVNWTKQL